MKKKTVITSATALLVTLGVIGAALSVSQQEPVNASTPAAVTQDADETSPETPQDNTVTTDGAESDDSQDADVTDDEESTPSGETNRQTSDDATIEFDLQGTDSDIVSVLVSAPEETEAASSQTSDAAPVSETSGSDNQTTTVGSNTSANTDASTDNTPSDNGSGSTQVGGATQTDDETSTDDKTETPDKKPGESGTSVIDADLIMTLTNAVRGQNGMTSLNAESALYDAAAIRAQEIATSFSHTRPDGSSCFTVINGNYGDMGENIAYISGKAGPEDFMNLWLNSDAHRANIMSNVFDGMAVGVYYDADKNATYAVQLFVQYKEDAVPTYTFTVKVIAPTCTEQGYTEHICNEDAAKSYKDNYVAALGHKYKDGFCMTCGAADPDYQKYTFTDTVVAPTCTEAGYTEHICNEDPHQSYKDSYVEALGHDYVDGICSRCGAEDPDYQPVYTYTDTVVAPTCTEQGYTEHVCNEDASKTYIDSYVAALGHDYVDGVCSRCGAEDPDYQPVYTFTDNVVAPTCTEQGYTEHICNEDASKTYIDSYVAALGHDYVDGICSRCGAEDPDYQKYTFTDEVVAPTCTEQGYTIHHCNEDDTQTYTDTYVDALGHDYVDGVCSRCGAEDPNYQPVYTYTDNVVAPTCTEQGYTEHVCNEDASKTYVDSYVAALGHDYVDGICSRCGAEDPDYKPVYTFTDEVIAPTCTEKGYTIHHCKEDDTQTYIDTYVDALGHNYVDGICSRCGAEDPDYQPVYTYTDNVVAPTCTEQGYTQHICNEDPSKTYIDTYVNALGHDYVNGVCSRCGETDPNYQPVYTYTDNIVAPTCTEQGYTEHICNEDPSKTYIDSYVDALGHDYVNGVCSRCGAEDPDYNAGGSDVSFDSASYNSTIYAMTNQARESAGHKALRYASEYQAAADIRAQEIVNYYSHTRPNGTWYYTVLDELGVEYYYVCENICWSNCELPEDVMDAWINSPGHYENMMSDECDSIIIASAYNPKDQNYYAVQIFFKSPAALEITTNEDEEAAMAAELNAVPMTDMPMEESASAEQPTDSIEPETAVEEVVPEETIEQEIVEEPVMTPAPTETPVETPAPTPVPTETPAPTPEPVVTPVETPAPAPVETPVTETVETPAPEVVETPAPVKTPAPEQETAPTEPAATETAPEPEVQSEQAAPAEESVEAPVKAAAEAAPAEASVDAAPAE